MAAVSSKKLITYDNLAYFKEKMDANMKAYVDSQIETVTGFEFNEVTPEEIDELFPVDAGDGEQEGEVTE